MESNMLPSRLLVLLMTLASSLHLIISVQAQTSSCDNEFFSMGTNITYCKRLRALGAELGWNFHSTMSNMTVDIVFSTRMPSSGGWVAWGVNPGHRAEMIGTRALIAFMQPNGTSTVMTYNVTHETKHGCKLEPSAIEIKVENIKSSYYGGRMAFAARLSLSPSEYNISRLKHVWQVGSHIVGVEPKKHSMMLQNLDSREIIDLTSGHSLGRSRDRLRIAHGVLSVIGWGFLLPVGVIVARYLRFPPTFVNRWFAVHVVVQISAFTIGTAAWGIGLSLANSSRSYKAFVSHWIIGITIFCLASLQMAALWLKPKKLDKYRKYWAVYHHFVGYTLITLIVVNIFKGFAILQPPSRWRWAYIAILIGLCFIAFVLEIAIWVNFFWKKLKTYLENRMFETSK